LKRVRQKSADRGLIRDHPLILNIGTSTIKFMAGLVHNRANNIKIDQAVKYVLKRAFVSTTERSPPRNVMLYPAKYWTPKLGIILHRLIPPPGNPARGKRILAIL
jgi:hypothetical protein